MPYRPIVVAQQVSRLVVPTAPHRFLQSDHIRAHVLQTGSQNFAASVPVGVIGRKQVERGDPENAGLGATSRAVNHFYSLFPTCCQDANATNVALMTPVVEVLVNLSQARGNIRQRTEESAANRPASEMVPDRSRCDCPEGKECDG